jgi:predicted hotdog family 3-hydroxylacyl-ACP dehydratase
VSEPAYPPIADVLPHTGRMVLLSRVLEHSASRTVCAVAIGDDAPFVDAAGMVPAWIGLEYMAQCVAAHAGLRAHVKGERPRIGFLVGARRVDFLASGFRAGQRLAVEAAHVWGDRESAAFTCRLMDAESGAVLAEGALTVYQPVTLDAFLPAPPR